MKIAKRIYLIAGLSLAISQFAFADAPVVDLSNSGSVPVQPLSMDQRVARLEQQMSNYTQMNLPARIDELQQQNQQLQGQLEVMQHDLQLLTQQQNKFYQDLDQRITALGANKSGAAVPAATATLPAAGDQATYQAAFSNLENKKYDQGVVALQKYIAAYPNGQYVANAHYWLGEVYFMQKKNAQAAQQFQAIVTKFPQDNKVPDAKLKLAFILDAAGKHDAAKIALRALIKQYPSSSAAQLAKLRLKTLGG